MLPPEITASRESRLGIVQVFTVHHAAHFSPVLRGNRRCKCLMETSTSFAPISGPKLGEPLSGERNAIQHELRWYSGSERGCKTALPS